VQIGVYDYDAAIFCPEAFDTAPARALAAAEHAFPRMARFKAFQLVRALVAPRS